VRQAGALDPLERFGARAREIAEKRRNGWPGVIARFTAFARTKEQAARD
jgi:hypothetical protein